jgi:hypothetical protein
MAGRCPCEWEVHIDWSHQCKSSLCRQPKMLYEVSRRLLVRRRVIEEIMRCWVLRVG